MYMAYKQPTCILFLDNIIILSLKTIIIYFVYKQSISTWLINIYFVYKQSKRT